jgi:GH24 family phage-related lysozyme (muramidase)
MRPAVSAIFPTFTATYEGRCSWMYRDVKGLITTAAGLLIDPVALAATLPWHHSDGLQASPDDIIAGWGAVKAMLPGRLATSYQVATDLRLADDAIDSLTRAKMSANDAILASRFAGWEDLPADAQLGVHSLAWACGPAFRFPHFEAALAVRDWVTCAIECRMTETGNPGLRARNIANVALFTSAGEPGDPSVVRGWPVK